MKKIIAYHLVTDIEPKLIEGVNELIIQGWQPFGGVAMTSYYDDGGTLWSQAMVIYEK